MDLNGLTALPDAWTGGLLMDMGLMKLRKPALSTEAHQMESELVVEFRSLTIALIDKFADGVRKRLGRSDEQLPLACVLEGGTATAGRRLAREKRPDGSPALIILSDSQTL